MLNKQSKNMEKINIPYVTKEDREPIPEAVGLSRRERIFELQERILNLQEKIALDRMLSLEQNLKNSISMSEAFLGTQMAFLNSVSRNIYFKRKFSAIELFLLKLKVAIRKILN